MCDLSDELIRRMLIVHFGTDSITDMSCHGCLDYKMSQCEGNNYSGLECYTCIIKHIGRDHKISSDDIVL
jgi:hypothetical protein